MARCNLIQFGKDRHNVKTECNSVALIGGYYSSVMFDHEHRIEFTDTRGVSSTFVVILLQTQG